MLENLWSKFAIVAIGVIHHDHMAIRADVFASHMDWPLVVTQSWWSILYGFAAEKGANFVYGIIIDHAPVEPIAFD